MLFFFFCVCFSGMLQYFMIWDKMNLFYIVLLVDDLYEFNLCRKLYGKICVQLLEFVESYVFIWFCKYCICT